MGLEQDLKTEVDRRSSNLEQSRIIEVRGRTAASSGHYIILTGYTRTFSKGKDKNINKWYIASSNAGCFLGSLP